MQMEMELLSLQGNRKSQEFLPIKNLFIKDGTLAIAALMMQARSFVEAESEEYLGRSRGSNWVQSLHLNDSEPKTKVMESNEQFNKHLIKCIIPEGFSGQMFKLQRKERTDRVIWCHKMNESKKVGSASLTLVINSILSASDIVVTVCSCSMATASNNFDCSPLTFNYEYYIVLFKKYLFSKQQLKVNDTFVLYEPWQCLKVLKFPYPVILCSYYIHNLHKPSNDSSQPATQDNNNDKEARGKSIYYSPKSHPNTVIGDPLSSLSLFSSSLSVQCRVQRVFCNNFSSDRTLITAKKDYMNFSLYCQTQEGLFFELKICPDDLPEKNYDFVTHTEGHCFEFQNLAVTHRYNATRNPKLFRILDIWKQQNGTFRELKYKCEKFCFQLMPKYTLQHAKKISNESLPSYCSYIVETLSQLKKGNILAERFSCIGKVLFHVNNGLYVTDESLLTFECSKYVKLKFSHSSKMIEKSLVGSTILIQEATVCKDYLILDQYSSFKCLSNGSLKYLLPYESRLNKISLISLEHVVLPLTLSSKLEELVCVEGKISSVDENTAVSWLECPICFQENLLEDSSQAIYCEDCSRPVPKPVLKVKMDASICTRLPSCVIKISLSSPTIKKLLKITEDSFRPQCNIADVLMKDTGVLFSYVKDCKTVGDTKYFHLVEI